MIINLYILVGFFYLYKTYNLSAKLSRIKLMLTNRRSWICTWHGFYFLSLWIYFINAVFGHCFKIWDLKPVVWFRFWYPLEHCNNCNVSNKSLMNENMWEFWFPINAQTIYFGIYYHLWYDGRYYHKLSWAGSNNLKPFYGAEL